MIAFSPYRGTFRERAATRYRLARPRARPGTNERGDYEQRGKTMKSLLRRGLMLALIGTTAFAITSTATAAVAPAPTGFFSGNINSCSSGDKSVEATLNLPGLWNGANSGSWPATTVSGDGLVVTISNVTTVSGQLVFDWSANLPVDLAIVKQGNGSAYWVFDPAIKSGTLASYKDGAPSGGVSHVLFCYHPCDSPAAKLLVSKTAETQIKKTYDWSISKKEKDGKTQLNGQVDGDAGTANYEVKVTKALASTEYSVSGVITVKNDSTTNLVAVNVTDTLPGATGLVLGLPCTGPFALAAGATVNCAYSANLPNADARVNTAHADSGSYAVEDGSGTAGVGFDDDTPVTLVHDSIAVSDGFATPGSTADDKHWTQIAATTTLTYARAFTCGSTSGSTSFTNTASIDWTSKSSSWTLTVNCAAKQVETPPQTPPATPAATTPPAATPTTTPPPFTPPATKPKPKPKPKAVKTAAVCTVIRVTQRSIPVGKQARVGIKLSAAGKPVPNTTVRLVGSGVNKTAKTARNGAVVVSVKSTKPGILRITIVGKKSCSSARVGVIGTFEPPVTG